MEVIGSRGEKHGQKILMLGGLIVGEEVQLPKRKDGAEMWVCEVFILPKKKYTNLVDSVAKASIGSAMTSGVLSNPEDFVKEPDV